MQIDRATRHLDLDPRDPAFVQDPYPAYAALQEATPVFFWRQYGHWCLAGHADVSAALRDSRFGRQMSPVASRATPGWPEPDPRLADFDRLERHSLLELEPPDHTRLRGLVNRGFVSRRIAHLRPAIAQLSHRLIDGFERAGACDLIDPFATQIPVLVIAGLLGVPDEHAGDLLAWSHDLVAMYQFRRSAEIEDRALTAARAFSAFLRALVAARRAQPRDDLISALIAAEGADDRLSEDELISTCVLILNAGHEATVHAIGNGVKALLEAGADPAAAFATPEATRATIEEMLRFDPPLHLFTRYALEDMDWRGLALRRGDRIGLLLAAANRDPAVFAAPGRFHPARAANPHVSFGGGLHFCLGAPLARLELDVALPILFQRLPGLRVAQPPVYSDSYHFRQLQALELAWEHGLPGRLLCPIGEARGTASQDRA